MLNSTIFGGYGAREALRKASHAGEIDTNWCVGGCEPWQDTEDGKARYEKLREINDRRKRDGLTHLE